MDLCLDWITSIKKVLTKEFQIQDLSVTTNFLRMQIKHDQKNRILWINQKAYTEGIILCFDMMNAKPLWMPLSEGIHLEKALDSYMAGNKFHQHY